MGKLVNQQLITRHKEIKSVVAVVKDNSGDFRRELAATIYSSACAL